MAEKYPLLARGVNLESLSLGKGWQPLDYLWMVIQVEVG